MTAFATWYDVLGVAAGADTKMISQAYQDKIGLLAAPALGEAPAQVRTVAQRTRELVDRAWAVLGDPGERQYYDAQLGLGSAQPGLDQPRLVHQARVGTVLPIGGYNWPAPALPGQRVRVPYVTGLFFREGCDVAGRAQLRVKTVSLTENPQPVEGLIVAQKPAAGKWARRLSTLQLTVWHPPQSAR